MIDREKVMKGLECMTNEDLYMSATACAEKKCPYAGISDCDLAIFHDALELLKEQEPRMLTLGEINKNSFVWYENKSCSRLFPALVSDCQSTTRHKFIVEDVFFDVGTYMPKDVLYGKSWRCWSARPTDEQREAVKWE